MLMAQKKKNKNRSRCFYDPCIPLPGKKSCVVNDCNDENEDIVVVNIKNKLQLRSVQFMHPGGEHQVQLNKKTGQYFTPWNYGRHKRKLIKTTGHYVKKGTLKKDELLFWGEWEPDSIATPFNPMPPASDKELPHYQHKPILKLNAKGNPIWPNPKKRATNTDPLVFGDSFYYSCCQQLRTYKKKKVTSPTLLHSLDRGSIILFGSPLNSRKPNAAFMLDTVFVVSDSKLFYTHQFENDLKGFVFNEYFPIMGLYSNGKTGFPFRCYKGATPKNNVDGMFSFAPCHINKPGIKPADLKRPLLRHSDFSGLAIPGTDIINERMTQGFKSRVVSLPVNKAIWQRVVDIVTSQGYELGVQFDI